MWCCEVWVYTQVLSGHVWVYAQAPGGHNGVYAQVQGGHIRVYAQMLGELVWVYTQMLSGHVRIYAQVLGGHDHETAYVTNCGQAPYIKVQKIFRPSALTPDLQPNLQPITCSATTHIVPGRTTDNSHTRAHTTRSRA